MKALRHLHRDAPGVFQALAACVVLSWFLALAMAVNPSLHEHLHDDAGHADHECVVTHLQAGSFGEATAGPVIAVDFVAEVSYVEPLAASGQVWVRPLYLDNGVLVHGPPGVA